MDYRTFAEAMRRGLVDAKSNGIEVVSVDDVLTHLSKLEVAISKQGGTQPTAVEEANQRSWEVYLEDHRANLSARNEMNARMFDSVIAAGQNAIRVLLTINGGAAVAVLAFLGHLASTGTAGVAEFSSPLLLFSGGVLLVGAAASGSYLSQLAFASSHSTWRRIGFVLQFATVAAGLVSIAAFALGAWDMGELFRTR